MKPSLLNNPILQPVFYIIGRIGLFVLGWKTHGKIPDLKKFILVAAPHSSNWDFVFFLLIIFKFRIPVHWMAKESMFIPPFKTLLIRLGGIPIDRSKNKNTVQVMAETFNNSDRLIVTIAPSGTRQRVRAWKSGFYHIAHQANVPIVCGFVDYKRKTGGIGPTLHPSGDMEADLDLMREFYKDKAGRY
ncbi:MAG: lysophospholipid acyltransferase family protein [Desulfobacterales bacterium]|nr:lysophospholipid acyltransferase family protein [Desulfobacterales bacterium]